MPADWPNAAGVSAILTSSFGSGADRQRQFQGRKKLMQNLPETGYYFFFLPNLNSKCIPIITVDQSIELMKHTKPGGLCKRFFV